MNDALNVFWSDKLVGRLWLDEQRRFVFQYDADWLAAESRLPLSIRLPLREDPFEADASKPFFVNLLPEADIRDRIARNLHVSETNDFRLLEELGGDCAGAIALLPEGVSARSGGGYKLITAAELDKMIEEMPRRPLLTACEGLRLSLAGSQEKLPIYFKDERIYLPTGEFPSSHILKPEIPRFDETVANEAFCMALAGKCGIPVPRTSIREGKHRALIVERYDRRVEMDDILIRIHQEDFCQALGYSHEQKYQDEGGPGLKDCFDLLKENSSDPLIDKRNLLRWVVFNYLIGNCDAHAKNVSLLIKQDGIRLAPFYDLMSTVIYEGPAKTLAMKIGGEKRPDWILKRHWERLAADAEVSMKAIVGICMELGEMLPTAAGELAIEFHADHGTTTAIPKIQTYCASMSKELVADLRESN